MAHTELSLRERRTIKDMLSARIPICKIAAEIGRHRATVYREIKRNRFVDNELPKLNGYYGMSAQRTAVNRRARRCKLVRSVDLRQYVIKQLVEGWSQAYLANIFDRIHDHKINRLDDLLLWNWAPMAAQSNQAA
ncbi:MAG: helix-turn-helix domain-containing protein [Alphaproteobacteria bacterium]|nr:helix-turn-helix domain-containing protein [Alphaproteobacteria bacterium]